MKLGILTAIWKRPVIARIVMDYYAGLEIEGIDLVLQAAVSPEDPTEHEIPEPWRVVEAPNDPLSDKTNAGSRVLRGEVDAIMITDSDDLISPAWIKACAEKEADHISAKHIYVHNSETGETIFVEPQCICAGAYLSKRFLDTCRWNVYPPGLNRHLDSKMRRERFDFPVQIIENYEATGMAILDIKGPDNIWSYDRFKGACRKTWPQCSEKVLSEFFPSVKDRVLALTGSKA